MEAACEEIARVVLYLIRDAVADQHLLYRQDLLKDIVTTDHHSTTSDRYCIHATGQGSLVR